MKFKFYILVICLIAIIKFSFAQLPYTSNFICLDSALRFGNLLKDSHKGMAIRDFNKDGKQDLAIVVNKLTTKEVVFYTNNVATSTVSSALFNEYSQNVVSTGTLASIANVNGISGGFFNVDSLPDVAFIDDNKLIIFANSTNTTGLNVPITGNFVTAYNFLTNYAGQPKFIKSADFNNDKKTDLVVLTENSASQLTLLIFRNTSVGNILSFVLDNTLYPYPGSSNLLAVQDCDMSLNDINNDTKDDILIMYRTSPPHVAYGYVNTTSVTAFSFNSFTFSPQGSISITSAQSDYKSCIITRINSGTINDIVFATNPIGGNSIISFVSNSTSTTITPLQSFTLPAVSDFIKDIVPIDLTGDFNKDLVILTSNITGANRILIYLFDPTTNLFNTNVISFLLPAWIDSKVNELAVLDYDNDNRMDLILKSWSKTTNMSSEYFYLIPNFANKAFVNPVSYAICSNTNIVITPTLSYNGENQFEWSISTASTNPVSTNLTFTLLPPLSTSINSYTFGFNVNLPYSAEKCNYKPLTINVSSLATPTVNLTSTKTIICAKDSITLNTINNSATSYTIFPLNLINQPSIILNPTISVSYTAVATASNGCNAQSVLQLSVHPTQKAEIASLAIYNICLNDSIHFKSNKLANSYLWSNGNINSNFYFKPNNNGIHLVTLTTKDENNCHTEPDSVQITVNDCSSSDTTIKTYHLVTPNNDGLNDVLFIENIHKYPNAEVTIFNRWGKQIFSKKSYNNASISWPGQNENIPSGTYYYTVTDGKILLLKGWTEILKN